MRLKIYLLLALILTVSSLSLSFSQEEAETGKTLVGDVNIGGQLEVKGDIKANKGLCLGDDCKNKWPALKCAAYDERPRGESGDAYCDSLGKTCSSVLITGKGPEYFQECSAAVNGPHKTRCCWIE